MHCDALQASMQEWRALRRHIASKPERFRHEIVIAFGQRRALVFFNVTIFVLIVGERFLMSRLFSASDAHPIITNFEHDREIRFRAALAQALSSSRHLTLDCLDVLDASRPTSVRSVTAPAHGANMAAKIKQFNRRRLLLLCRQIQRSFVCTLHIRLSHGAWQAPTAQCCV